MGGGLEATTLALYVNGKRIAVAEDRDGFDSFPGFGFFVFASTSGTDVRFDNLVAREPTETETQPVATVSQRVQAPSTSTATAHSGSKLCRRDGIRYSGTTAQGAEVCFTLTPDGSALIEAGFSFVRASGCPSEAAGTTYSEIPGAVDAHGRVENPDGFTATIGGSRASGVFEDSTICPGKKFNWSARRVP